MMCAHVGDRIQISLEHGMLCTHVTKPPFGAFVGKWCLYATVLHTTFVKLMLWFITSLESEQGQVVQPLEMS